MLTVDGNGALADLVQLYNDLNELVGLVEAGRTRSLTEAKRKKLGSLHADLGIKAGQYKQLVAELSGDASTADLWLVGFTLPINKTRLGALRACTEATHQAIGKLQADINSGRRDRRTGAIVEIPGPSHSKKLKAFVAHEGETDALGSLEGFLRALGIESIVAEAQPSGGRSIEGQVDWSQEKADFAVILATKGKAINKISGKHYMGLNVADELASARHIYGQHIILLVQKGVEVHTNKKEIVHGEFTSTNMQQAFIKIVKELRSWGFLTIGKTASKS